MWKCQNCGLQLKKPTIPVYCSCGIIDRRTYDKPEPGWVRIVGYFEAPEDIGVGDTVARYAAMLGGELFKAWSKRIGLPCGCTQRQAEWNRLYPYQRSESKQGAPMDADNPGVG